MKQLIKKFNSLSDTTKGFIIVIIALLIGIIVRWRYIIDSAISGFQFFSK